MSENTTLYVTSTGYDLAALYKMELELDFLPCIVASQDRHEQQMRLSDPTWSPPNGATRPRSVFFFDGGDEHMKAIFEPSGEAITPLAQYMINMNIGACKFSASRSKSQQPMDVAKFFCNTKKFIKSYKYLDRDMDDLGVCVGGVMKAALKKFRDLPIPASSKKTFERFLMQFSEIIGAHHSVRVQTKSWKIAGSFFIVQCSTVLIVLLRRISCLFIFIFLF